MFWTCRATVRSLMTSSVAISRLLLPLATSRRTSNLARAQPVSVRRSAAGELSTRAISGAAPSSRTRRARPRAPPPRCRRRPARRRRDRADTRARAASYGASSSCQVVQALRERGERAAGIALGERDRASGVRGRRGEQLAPLPPRDLIELSAGGSRRFEVSDGKGDLDLGGSSAARRSGRTVSSMARRMAAAAALPCPGPGAAERGPVAARGRAGRLPVERLGVARTRLEPMELAFAVCRVAEGALVQNASPEALSDRAASSSASTSSPRVMISARCTRQRPLCATISGCSSHHRVSAAVHSRARRSRRRRGRTRSCCSRRCRDDRRELPRAAAAMVSSTSRRPSSIRP